MSERNLIKIQEVAMLIDSSVQTISGWYRWKRQFPDNEYAKMLPDYQVIGNKNTRFWNRDDVWKLIEFKKSIPQGCKGVMGAVTQKYVKKPNKG